MEFAWILFGLLGWALGILLVLVLLQVAGDEQRAARRVERNMNLHSETPVTKPDSHTETGDRSKPG
jgi:hypothetical protein